MVGLDDALFRWVTVRFDAGRQPCAEAIGPVLDVGVRRCGVAVAAVAGFWGWPSRRGRSDDTDQTGQPESGLLERTAVPDDRRPCSDSIGGVEHVERGR
jgi:hypothetical protein